MARSRLRIRFIGDVDGRLKPEVGIFTRWLRRWYSFPVVLEIRLIHAGTIIDDDGASCTLRWWQNARSGSVIGELAVSSFARHLEAEGGSVAYPTVMAAIARLVKYYYQIIRDKPIRKDRADAWGDRVLAAYVHEQKPPPPFRGARLDSRRYYRY